MRRVRLAIAIGLLVLGGCGTTRWSDTPRTATEQLLLSDAVDRAVSKLDMNVIAGQSVYLDCSPVRQCIDSPYLISTVRQHLMASDCVIKEKADDADLIVELRAGTMGTDRHELLFGVPATTLPSSTPGAGAQIIPELPLAKRTDQRAVAKIALFVYNRYTGRPVWQSGTIPVESKARDLWVFGAGPFQRGSIHQGTKFAGHNVPALVDTSQPKNTREPVEVTQEAIFNDPRDLPSLPAQPPVLATPPSVYRQAGVSGPAASIWSGQAIPPTAPAPAPNASVGPSGMSNGFSTPIAPTPTPPATTTTGVSNGFSPYLQTRLPELLLPHGNRTETAEPTVVR